MSDYVTLKQLAEEFNIDRSNIRRFILSLGITAAKIRTQDSRQQLTLAVTPSEADRIRATRKAAGFKVRDPEDVIEQEEGLINKCVDWWTTKYEMAFPDDTVDVLEVKSVERIVLAGITAKAIQGDIDAVEWMIRHHMIHLPEFIKD